MSCKKTPLVYVCMSDRNSNPLLSERHPTSKNVHLKQGPRDSQEPHERKVTVTRLVFETSRPPWKDMRTLRSLPCKTFSTNTISCLCDVCMYQGRYVTLLLLHLTIHYYALLQFNVLFSCKFLLYVTSYITDPFHSLCRLVSRWKTKKTVDCYVWREK